MLISQVAQKGVGLQVALFSRDCRQPATQLRTNVHRFSRCPLSKCDQQCRLASTRSADKKDQLAVEGCDFGGQPFKFFKH
mgnify:CR=1 FL=1